MYSCSGKKILLTGVASISILTGASHAWADDAADDAVALEEVIVTATRHSKNLMETPVAVSAMTQAALTRQGVKELRDMTALVPNVQFSFSPADSGVQASIRGVTNFNNTEVGDPAVGIHVDGMYSPRPQAALALMYDLERVEILRGPQGTLFGRNSPAGAINIIAAKPDTSETYGNIMVGYGNYDHQQIRAMANIRLGDTLAARFAVMKDDRDGYIKQDMDVSEINRPDQLDAYGNPFIPDGIPDFDQRLNHKVDKDKYYTNSDKWAARGMLRWTPTNAIDWTVTYEHFQDSSAGDLFFKDCAQSEGTNFACTEQQFYANINVPGKMDMTIDSIRSAFTYDITDSITASYLFGFARQQRMQDHDDDAGFRPSEESTANPAVDRYARTRYSDYRSLVHEVQLRSQSDNGLSWVAGGFLMNEKNKVRFDVETNSFAAQHFAFIYPQDDRRVRSRALFAQVDYDLTEQLSLTLGYRQTWDKKIDNGGTSYEQEIDYYAGRWDGTFRPQSDILDFDMGSFGDIDARIGNAGFTFHEESWTKGTWKAGINYQYDDDTLLYANVSTGYKAGGFVENTDICNCGELSNLPYDPETVTTYELGYKASLFDKRLDLSVAAFYSDYNDMQQTGFRVVGTDPATGNPVSKWRTDNVSKARIKGVEVEFNMIPWENGSLSGYAAWMDAEVVERPSFNDNYYCETRARLGQQACATGFIDISGNQLTHSPEWSFTVNYQHTIEASDGFVVLPFVSIHWQDKMFLGLRNYEGAHLSEAQPAYWKLDASIKLMPEDEKWYLEIYGSNLTNEYIRNHNSPYVGFEKQDYVMSSYNAPRMYGMRLGYNW